jgi:hypothetical protein
MVLHTFCGTTTTTTTATTTRNHLKVRVIITTTQIIYQYLQSNNQINIEKDLNLTVK